MYYSEGEAAMSSVYDADVAEYDDEEEMTDEEGYVILD